MNFLKRKVPFSFLVTYVILLFEFWIFFLKSVPLNAILILAWDFMLILVLLYWTCTVLSPHLFKMLVHMCCTMYNLNFSKFASAQLLIYKKVMWILNSACAFYTFLAWTNTSPFASCASQLTREKNCPKSSQKITKNQIHLLKSCNFFKIHLKTS